MVKDCCGRRLRDLKDSEWVSLEKNGRISRGSDMWTEEVYKGQSCGYICSCGCKAQAVCVRCIKRLGLLW